MAISFSNKTQLCARDMVETIPQVMRFIGYQMRRHSGLSISMPQLKLLSFISRNPGTSLSLAADDLSVTSATASNLVDRLVKKGYVKREVDPRERRRILLSLTEEGTKQFEQAKSIAQAAIAAKLSQLPDNKQETVLACMQIIKEAFAETDQKGKAEANYNGR